MVQVPPERLIVSLSPQCGDYAPAEFMDVVRGEVAQSLPPQPSLQPFYRCERRHPLGAQADGEPDRQGVDRLAFVHVAPVLDHHEPTAQSFEHRLRECGHEPVIEVAVGQRVELQHQAVAAGRQPQLRGDRDFLPVDAALADRRDLSLGRLRPAGHRVHQKAALVDHGDGRLLPPGLFLMRGLSDSSQLAIAFWSRSRGTSCGVCGDYPVPQPGAEAPRINAAIQRRTERGSISRNSAISAVEYLLRLR